MRRAPGSSGRDPSRWTSHATGSARAPRRRTCPRSSLSLVTTTTPARAATGRPASSSVSARSAVIRPACRTTIPRRASTRPGEPGSGCPSRMIDVVTVGGTLAWRRARRSRNAPGSALPASAWRRLLPSTRSSFTPCHGSRGRLTGARPAESARWTGCASSTVGPADDAPHALPFGRASPRRPRWRGLPRARARPGRGRRAPRARGPRRSRRLLHEQFVPAPLPTTSPTSPNSARRFRST